MKLGKTRFLILLGLTGLVSFVPALASLASPAPVASGAVVGKINVSGLRNAANALVYVASAPGQFAPRGTPSMDQRSIAFQPHVLPVVAGTTVNFINSDDVQHNVFTPSAAGDFFNLGAWPKGQTKSYTFTKVGKVELLCNVHHEMHGYILVLQNPFFALTDKEGNFRIENVPAGTYTLKVWHEHGTAPAQVVNLSNGVSTVQFELVSR